MIRIEIMQGDYDYGTDSKEFKPNIKRLLEITDDDLTNVETINRLFLLELKQVKAYLDKIYKIT